MSGTRFHESAMPVVPRDYNPERVACVLCGDTAGLSRRLETVIGMVCPECFNAGSPESAPYYADWQRSGDRYYRSQDQAFARNKRKGAAMPTLRVVGR